MTGCVINKTLNRNRSNFPIKKYKLILKQLDVLF